MYPGRPFSQIEIHTDRLDQPYRWKKPRMVFVNSTAEVEGCIGSFCDDESESVVSQFDLARRDPGFSLDSARTGGG